MPKLTSMKLYWKKQAVKEDLKLVLKGVGQELLQIVQGVGRDLKSGPTRRRIARPSTTMPHRIVPGSWYARRYDDASHVVAARRP